MSDKNDGKQAEFSRDDFGWVNCAGCDREAIGERSFCRAVLYVPPDGKPGVIRADDVVVAGRIGDRPYCGTCLPIQEAEVRKPPAGWGGPVEDTSPWQHNAIRIMEDAGERLH